MDCMIREARRSDLRDIYLIELKSFPYPYSLEAFTGLLILFPKLFLVAVCEGRIAGYIMGSITDSGEGHIMSIAVHPQYRGGGVGTALLEAIEEVYRSLGVKRVFLEVSTTNREAMGLYKKFNYRLQGTKSNYYPDGSDAYVMAKEL